MVLDWSLVYNYLLNINFGGNLHDKAGPAAIGQSTNDYWNPWYYPWSNLVTVTSLPWANGTTSGVGVTVQNAPGDWANGCPDPMMDSYMYASGQGFTVTLTNLPAPGTWDFYLYGHGPTTDNGVFNLICGSTNYGQLSTAVSGWDTLTQNPTNWVEDDEYVVFRGVSVGFGQSVVINILTNNLGSSLICGLQANLTAGVPPTITCNPSGQTVAQGGTASFSVAASGTQPLSFQWRKNSQSIAGATATALVITNVQPGDAGAYSAIVANILGDAISTNATLVVNTSQGCANPPSGLVAWWRAEYNANDQLGAHNGTAYNGVTYGQGEVGSAFVLDGVDDHVRVANSPALRFTRGMTLEAWVNPVANVPTTGDCVIANWDVVFAINQRSFALWLEPDGTPALALSSDGGYLNVVNVTGTNSVLLWTWTHLAGTYDGTNAMLYVNGTLQGTVPWPWGIYPGHQRFGHWRRCRGPPPTAGGQCAARQHRRSLRL